MAAASTSVSTASVVSERELRAQVSDAEDRCKRLQQQVHAVDAERTTARYEADSARDRLEDLACALHEA